MYQRQSVIVKYMVFRNLQDVKEELYFEHIDIYYQLFTNYHTYP